MCVSACVCFCVCGMFLLLCYSICMSAQVTLAKSRNPTLSLTGDRFMEREVITAVNIHILCIIE